MRTFLIMVVGLVTSPTWAGDAQVEIVISRDYAKTSDITINGTKVTGPHVLDELARDSIRIGGGEEVDIIIKMPKITYLCSNWNDIRRIDGKDSFRERPILCLLA